MTKQALNGILRYLTGSELERMIEAFKSGKAVIEAPRGQKLTPSEFKFVASKLGRVL
jgi:hypothetical protein